MSMLLLFNQPASTAYTLSCAAGAYSVAGQATPVKAQRKVAAAAGAYSYAGQAAAVKTARLLGASAGAYALAGQSAGAKAARTVSGGAGTYSVAGQATVTRVARKLAGSAGNYGVAGQAATLVKASGAVSPTNYALTCTSGVYAVGGVDAQFTQFAGLQPAGGYEDDKKRKPRFVIEVDGRLVEFRSEREAIAALKAQDKAVAVERIEAVAIQPKPMKAKAAVVEPEYDDEEDIELLLMAL